MKCRMFQSKIEKLKNQPRVEPDKKQVPKSRQSAEVFLSSCTWERLFALLQAWSSRPGSPERAPGQLTGLQARTWGWRGCKGDGQHF